MIGNISDLSTKLYNSFYKYSHLYKLLHKKALSSHLYGQFV